MSFFVKKIKKYLLMSKKSSTFAPAFDENDKSYIVNRQIVNGLNQ